MKSNNINVEKDGQWSKSLIELKNGPHPIPNEWLGGKITTYYYYVGDKIITSSKIILSPGFIYAGYAIRQYVKDSWLHLYREIKDGP